MPDRIDDINKALAMLDEIFRKCEEEHQHDILRSVIENMMAKPYLDTIQAILLKDGSKN